MNKALAKLNRDEVMWKAKNAQALNLLELSLVSGYSYAQWSSWKYRGLPLVQGKISVHRALEWVMAEEMVPDTQTDRIYDLCDKMASALFAIWVQLQFKQDPVRKTDLCQKIDEISSEYAHLKRCMVTPSKPDIPSTIAVPIVEAPKLVTAVVCKPFKKSIQEAIRKANAGMALNLSELSRVLGYSKAVMSLWKKEGLPLLDGKIIKADAVTWRKTHVEQHPTSVSHLIPASLRSESPRAFYSRRRQRPS